MELTRGAPENRIPAQIGRFVDRVGSSLQAVDLEDTIFLTGVPRSGSTWVMNLLATLPGHKSIFEPLHPDWWAPIRDLDVGPRPALRPGDRHEAFRAYLEGVLAGRISGAYADYDLSPGSVWRRVNAHRLVVKSVRLTRSLPWLVSEFDLRQVFLLVRHPCAVVASQRRTGIRGHFTLPEERLDRDAVIASALDALGDEAPDELVERIRGLTTEVEALSLLWAVDYALGLAGASEEVQVLRYERLVEGGPRALQAVFEALGEEVPPAAQEAYGRPSHTARGDVHEGQADQQRRWAAELDREEGERIAEIVGWFGFEDVSFDEPGYSLPREGPLT